MNIARLMTALAWLLAVAWSFSSVPGLSAPKDFPTTLLELEMQAHDDSQSLLEAVGPILREFNPTKITHRDILAFVALIIVPFQLDSSFPSFEQNLPLLMEAARNQQLWPEYLRLKAKSLYLQMDKDPDTVPDFNALIQEAKDRKVSRLSAVFQAEFAAQLYLYSKEVAASQLYSAVSRIIFDPDLHEFDRAMIKNRLAIYLDWKKQPDRAQQLYDDAYRYSKKAKIRNLQSDIGYNLGRLYVDQKIPALAEKSLVYFQESAEIARSMKNNITVGSNALGLAMAYLVLAKIDPGIASIREAITIFQEEGDQDWLATAYLVLARLQIKQGNLQSGIDSFEQSLQLLSKENISQVLLVETELAGAYALLQNWEKAYQHEARARVQSDTYYQQLSQKKLAEESAQIGLSMLSNDLKIKELELKNQNDRLKFSMTMAILSFVSLVSMSLLFTRLHSRNKKVQNLQTYIQKSVLARFLPPLLVEEIIQGKSRIESQPREESITVLFSDIVEFTQLSGQLGAIEISGILNSFMKQMTEVIYRHEGTIDKFIGDSVMVIFGAPLPIPEKIQADRAVACAHDMIRALSAINQELKPAYGIEIHMRIGINQGPAIVGTFGSEKRSDYTAIGPTVNVASRIEGKAKPNEILVSPAFAQHLAMDSLEDRGFFKLKGIETELNLFALKECPSAPTALGIPA